MRNREKDDIKSKWINENSKALAEEFFKIWGKNEEPQNIVTYQDFCQYLINITYSIKDKFDEFDKSGEYTNSLSEYVLSDRDKAVFIGALIADAALIVTSNIFIHDKIKTLDE